MIHLTRLLVGGGALFVGMAFMAGGIGNALGILVLLVICTLGVSLALIGPLAYAVGWVLIEILTLIFPRLRAPTAPPPAGNA